MSEQTVLSLTQYTPNADEKVFTYDAFTEEWVYARYKGLVSGRHRFEIAQDSTGGVECVDTPTHFFRVQMPGKPINGAKCSSH